MAGRRGRRQRKADLEPQPQPQPEPEPQVAPEPRLTKAGVGLPLEQTAEAGLRQQVAELQKQGPGARARSQNLVRYPAVSL